MKEIVLKIFFITCILSYITSCSEMNDKHDFYFQNGERIYIGKIDSLHVFPGDNRVQIRFWSSDPRCKKVGFYWYPSGDSLIAEINRTASIDSFDVYLGDIYGTTSISEGSYTFRIITFDNEGNSSIPVEKIVNVYGDTYRSSLNNRPLRNVNYNSEDKNLILDFSELAINEAEVCVEIFYTDLMGELKTMSVTSDSLDIYSKVNIYDIDPNEEVTYSTKFLPHPLAIDTFAADFNSVEIEEIINVALNKPVLVSDEHVSGNYPGKNAVDGINFTNETRWVSTAEGEHWIEIDLEQEYNVFSIETWNGSNGNLSNPVPEFMFQVEVDGEWITVANETNNKDGGYKALFPEIITKKVRYFIPEYSGNMVRLYEIAVYAIIRY